MGRLFLLSNEVAIVETDDASFKFVSVLGEELNMTERRVEPELFGLAGGLIQFSSALW